MVDFEVSLEPTEGQRSAFDEATVPTVETVEEYRMNQGRAINVARRLENNGAKVRDIGEFSISAQMADDEFEALFSTRLETLELPDDVSVPSGYPSMRVPRERVTAPAQDHLQDDIERVYVQSAPIPFAETPLPSLTMVDDKFRLRVPGDIAQVMKASGVHSMGVTGNGVRVAMIDSGFYHHPYFKAQGYDFLSVPAPDIADPEQDASGHGTGEAANLFATAPGINFIGVKMGNPTLAFRTAAQLNPRVITCSWGYHADFPGTSLPNWAKPLYLEILSAVRRGAVTCFSAGNGHRAFPANMPQVIAVGGVACNEQLDLSATSYTSGFDSSWFPGRRVPDVSGLCGEPPKADFIVLPVPETAGLNQDHGWGAFSGTSAASPMVAGVCALLLEADGALSPANVKHILQYTATDIVKGSNAMGDKAVPGPDLATGYGLVDAKRAMSAVV